MSDGSTTDDDDVEEMDLPSWVREAASRCPGLVSEASLAKRKREQEEADLAFAQQLQRDGWCDCRPPLPAPRLNSRDFPRAATGRK